MGAHSPMTKPFSLAMFVGAMLVLSVEAWSQDQPAPPLPLTVGSTIRLQAPTIVQGRLQGRVMEVDDESLLISQEDRLPVRVSRQAITRLEVRTGRHRQTLTGMCIGAGIGALLGVTFPCIAMVGCDQRNGGAAALADGLGGAAWGAGIGALIRRDHWSAVPPVQLRMTLVPTPGRGVGLSVSMSF